MANKKVGLIGCGLMGLPMAENWIKGQHQVSILAHKNRGPIEKAKSLGAMEVKDHRELSQNSQILVLMLPTSIEVEENISKLVPHLNSNQIVIDMSTSDPQSTIKIHNELKKSNLRFFDCPVTGGVFGAQSGKLNLFIGGPESWVQESMPVLKSISQKQTHFGEAGSGHIAKLINNFICIGNVAVFTEILPVAAKLGIDSQKLLETLLAGTAHSRQLEFYGQQILDGDFAARYKHAHALKDLNLAKDLITKFNYDFPLLQGMLKVFLDSSDFGQENLTSVIKPVETALKPFRK